MNQSSLSPLSSSNIVHSHVSHTCLERYIKSLNEKELKAYHIAKEHLGMSFQLEKSIGYLNWKKENVSP